jgi:RNA polymerase sigma-70 factor (ECF subfamily)
MMREGFDSVWRLLRRLGVPANAAEDAAQEVFVVAARRIDSIAPGSERSYLFGTTLRVAKGFQRRGAREALRHAPLDETRLPGPATPEALLDERQQLAILDQALATLADGERSVFVLFELEGLTLSEISQLMSIPRGTVASRLRRARSRFVRALAARRRGQPARERGPNG